MRLLLAEDEPLAEEAVRLGLTGAGFTVDRVADGQDAELAIASLVHDIVVMDFALPRKDGMTVLKSVRHKGIATPILIATARHSVADRVAVLNAGADDCVPKPCDPEELVARLRAALRRYAAAHTVATCGPLRLDTVRRIVFLRGEAVSLSPRELAIVEVLMHRPGAVVSRKKLEDSVYGWGEEVESNAVEVHLHNIRKKLGTDTVMNVRGVGYRIASA